MELLTVPPNFSSPRDNLTSPSFAVRPGHHVTYRPPTRLLENNDLPRWATYRIPVPSLERTSRRILTQTNIQILIRETTL